MTQNFTNNYFKLFPSHYKNLPTLLPSFAPRDRRRRPVVHTFSDDGDDDASRIVILPEEVLQLAAARRDVNRIGRGAGRAVGQNCDRSPKRFLVFFLM